MSESINIRDSYYGRLCYFIDIFQIDRDRISYYCNNVNEEIMTSEKMKERKKKLSKGLDNPKEGYDATKFNFDQNIASRVKVKYSTIQPYSNALNRIVKFELENGTYKENKNLVAFLMEFRDGEEIQLPVYNYKDILKSFLTEKLKSKEGCLSDILDKEDTFCGKIEKAEQFQKDIGLYREDYTAGTAIDLVWEYEWQKIEKDNSLQFSLYYYDIFCKYEGYEYEKGEIAKTDKKNSGIKSKYITTKNLFSTPALFNEYFIKYASNRILYCNLFEIVRLYEYHSGLAESISKEDLYENVKEYLIDTFWLDKPSKEEYKMYSKKREECEYVKLFGNLEKSRKKALLYGDIALITRMNNIFSLYGYCYWEKSDIILQIDEEYFRLLYLCACCDLVLKINKVERKTVQLRLRNESENIDFNIIMKIGIDTEQNKVIIKDSRIKN